MGEKTSSLGSQRQRYTNCKSTLLYLTTPFQGYLIGNKNDVNQDRQVITDKEANKLATELGLKYFKVLFKTMKIEFLTSSNFRLLHGKIPELSKPSQKWVQMFIQNGLKTQIQYQF